MQSDLIPFVDINWIRNFLIAPIENIMSSTIFCLNVAVRTAAAERCAASRLAARSCRRTFTSQTQSLIQSSPRTLSMRQPPLPSRSEARIALAVSSRPTADRRRTYAVDAGQNANTIQGTIGKGASGVEEVAQRVKEKLQSPDHLNEKEKMIFEKLDGALEPTKLEVCHIILGWKRRQGRVRT
jgi:hypothetical protein